MIDSFFSVLSFRCGFSRKSYSKSIIALSISSLDMQEGSSEYILLESNNFIENYRKIWERLILTNGIEDSQLASETPVIEALIFMDYIKEMS